jgi:hypothetical protein
VKLIRYAAEFKAEVVNRVTNRLGMSDKSLYIWVVRTISNRVWTMLKTHLSKPRYIGLRLSLREAMRSMNLR